MNTERKDPIAKAPQKSGGLLAKRRYDIKPVTRLIKGAEMKERRRAGPYLIITPDSERIR